jgi:hypothetical protein
VYTTLGEVRGMQTLLVIILVGRKNRRVRSWQVRREIERGVGEKHLPVIGGGLESVVVVHGRWRHGLHVRSGSSWGRWCAEDAMGRQVDVRRSEVAKTMRQVSGSEELEFLIDKASTRNKNDDVGQEVKKRSNIQANSKIAASLNRFSFPY